MLPALPSPPPSTSPSATSTGSIPRQCLSPLPGNDPVSLSDTFGVQVLTVMLAPAQTVPFSSCSPKSQETAPINPHPCPPEAPMEIWALQRATSLSCSASLGEQQQEHATGEKGNCSPVRMKMIFISTGENGFNKYLPLHSHFPQQRPSFCPTAPSLCWYDVGAKSHSSESLAAEEKYLLKSPFLLIPSPQVNPGTSICGAQWSSLQPSRKE